MAAETTGTVRGLVRYESGAPVSYASVIIVGTQMGAMTHENGTFKVSGVPTGEYTLRTIHSMIFTDDRNIIVEAGKTTALTITLEERVVKGIVTTNPGVKIYHDALRGFAFDVPPGWNAEKAEFSACHYRDVFAVVCNRDTVHRVTEQQTGNTWTYGPEVIANQLPPGAVYIDMAISEGPGASASYGPCRDDSFERERQSFLRNPKKWGTNDLDAYTLNFVKWGGRWEILIACKKPYSKQDREMAFELVRSLRFLEVPIVNAAQAVGAAVEFVPAFAQPVDSIAGPNGECACCVDCGWLANGGRDGRRQTLLKRLDDGFAVTFLLFEDGNSDRVEGTWSYLVRWDGTVEPIRSEGR